MIANNPVNLNMVMCNTPHMSKFFQIPAPNFVACISKWIQIYSLLNIPAVSLLQTFPNPLIYTFPKWSPVITPSECFGTVTL